VLGVIWKLPKPILVKWDDESLTVTVDRNNKLGGSVRPDPACTALPARLHWTELRFALTRPQAQLMPRCWQTA
jgi:hypothetical protein